MLLLCCKYSAAGSRLSGCGALELGRRWCLGWLLIVLLGGGVSDESVWGGEVSWAVAVKNGGALVSGTLSVLPLLSAACVIDVSWLLMVVVGVTRPAC